MKKILLFPFLCTLLFSATSAEAAYTIRNGRLVDTDDIATLSMEEHARIAASAYECGDWREACIQYRMITCSFGHTNYGKECFFFLGVALYMEKEYEFANKAFSDYILSCSHPEYFDEAMEYKFLIAEAYRKGAKRHMMGMRRMPRWLTAENFALETYDEVIAAMPCHELAAQSLFSKGVFQWYLKDFSDAVDTLQLLIRRFPTHELAPEAYITISKIYVEQAYLEVQNSDIIALADMNCKKFCKGFPKEPRLRMVECDCLTVKEIYAKGLYETGQFYERICKPEASCIYYQRAISRFPETNIARCCERRLAALGRCYECPPCS